MFEPRIDETNAQHGTWRVLREVDPRWRKAHWELECVECGHTRIIDGVKLRTKAPGCSSCLRIVRERRKLHHAGHACECGELVDVREWKDDKPLSYRGQCRPCINETRRKRVKVQAGAE